jgi:uncharacterized membrane protein
MSFLLQWFYILALALWVGGMVFFSFLTTPVIFSTLPKEMAGQVLAALFPRYYQLGYLCGGILLAMTLIEALLVRHLPLIRLLFIGLMVGMTLYAGMALRPQIHDLKVEIRTVEEASPRGGELKKQFSRAHRLSVILNMIVLACGLFLVGILAFRLRL